MVEKSRAVDLVMELMAIPGQSGDEAEIAGAVLNTLREFGVPQSSCTFDSAHKKARIRGQTGNLIVKLPGRRGASRRMLSAHLDTVPICVGCRPKRTGGVIRSADKTTGLGADDRAGVAAVLISYVEALEAAETELPPLTLCFFIQEEIGLQGSRFLTLSKLGKPEMALNFDGGNPTKLTIGATGGETIWIKLQGIPAHAGLAPQEGASAVNAASLAIASLVKDGWLGAVKKSGKVGTSNIGFVRGGNATNVVAEHCEVAAEARSHDGAFRTKIAAAIEKAFLEAARQVRSDSGESVHAVVERHVDYHSFKLSAKAKPVRIVAEAIENLGAEPVETVTAGGVDANWLVKHGIPTVTVGCGQRNVHTTNEALDIEDFLKACEIGKQFILQRNWK